MISKADFAQQIRRSLENIHDSVYLQGMPLAKTLAQHNQGLDQTVRQLRSLVLESIDALRPAANLPPRSREMRPYAILYGRYVQGMETTDLTEELAISVRQLRREHKRALSALVDRMWELLSEKLAGATNLALPVDLPKYHEAAEVETAHLITHAEVEHLDFFLLLQGILETLESLAIEHNIRIVNRVPETLPSIRVARTVLRQALFELLAYAIDHIEAGQLEIVGRVDEKAVENNTRQQVVVILIEATGYRPKSDMPGTNLQVSESLLASIGGELTITSGNAQWLAMLRMPVAAQSTVLVIDDNESLVELFRRYLAGQPFRLLHAQTAKEAIQVTEKNAPKLIFLDVMMPKEDGWEVLQQLRKNTTTHDLPIVICSVIYEPAIARTLNASDYLVKPVTRDALLTMVERWCGD
jgi:CheY-like chemotaxis protein